MARMSEVPTLAGVAGVDQARRARRGRRLGVSLLVLVVVAACLGWLGPRDASATAGALTVTYPQITRSGADSALTVEAEGIDTGAAVVVEVPQIVFDRLGLEAMLPVPTAESSDGHTVRLTFEAPRTGGFSVMISGRLGTRSELGAFSYDVRLLVERADPLEASARTWVLP